jgi:hypothetical protein
MTAFQKSHHRNWFKKTALQIKLPGRGMRDPGESEKSAESQAPSAISISSSEMS